MNEVYKVKDTASWWQKKLLEKSDAFNPPPTRRIKI